MASYKILAPDNPEANPDGYAVVTADWSPETDRYEHYRAAQMNEATAQLLVNTLNEREAGEYEHEVFESTHPEAYTAFFDVLADAGVDTVDDDVWRRRSDGIERHGLMVLRLEGEEIDRVGAVIRKRIEGSGLSEGKGKQ